MASELDYSVVPADNTAVNGVGITGSDKPSNLDDAMRNLVANRANAQPRGNAKSANYSADKDDFGKLFSFSGAYTLTIPAISTLANGWFIFAEADAANALAISRSGSDTINGLASVILPPGRRCKISVGASATDIKVDFYSRTADFPRGHIYGLTLANNAADATNDIDIASGEAASDGVYSALMVLGAALTKRLDAAWSVGSGNGGLDTGSIANTTYHVWLIQRSDTGVVDALFSASATAPTMPANYDRKRRIGSIIRSAGAILGFVQDGDKFTYKAPISDFTASNPGTSAVTRTLTVPTGIRVEAFGTANIYLADTSTTVVAYLSDLAVDDASLNINSTATIVAQSLATSGTYRGFAPWSVMTNTSAQIRSRLDVSTANISLRVGTQGWIDRRGRV